LSSVPAARMGEDMAVDVTVVDAMPLALEVTGWR
jgi:hypothetical protein